LRAQTTRREIITPLYGGAYYLFVNDEKRSLQESPKMTEAWPCLNHPRRSENLRRGQNYLCRRELGTKRGARVMQACSAPGTNFLPPAEGKGEEILREVIHPS
jgi:hypothetical protein